MDAATVIGGLGTLAQIAGSYYTNMQNAKNQLAINKNNIGMQYAFNADQIAVAQMNNQTQIDMANTAHQREVQDLRDAGLNPILSATGGNGAAMPSLGNPNGISAPEGQAFKADNPLREFGTSAKEIGRLMSAEYQAHVELAKSQVEEQKIYNRMLKDEALANHYKSRLSAQQSQNELDAYDYLAEPRLHISSDGEAHLAKPHWQLEDSPYRLDPEILDAIKKGILSDISNRRWSDVQRWIDTGSRAAGAASGFLPQAKALKASKALRH